MTAAERREKARSLWSAGEWFETQMALAAEERYGELSLLSTLRGIATGDIGQRSAGAAALEVIEGWKRDRP